MIFFSRQPRSRFRYSKQHRAEGAEVMRLLEVSNPANPDKTYLDTLREKAATVERPDESRDDIIQRAFSYMMHGETRFEITYERLIKESPEKIFARVDRWLDEIVAAEKRINRETATTVSR